MASTIMLMRPINIVGKILVARILAPSDFGAVALAMLFIESSDLFVGLGMDSAIIHSDLDRRKVAFHAFVIATVSSVIITIFALTNSAMIASLLGDPDVEPILRVLSLQFVITAWTIVPAAQLRKDLKFGAIAKSNLLSRIAYMIVALVLALLGFGVWSLVISYLTQSILAMVIIWWLAPSRNWLKPVSWDWSIFKGLLSYGSKSTGSGIVRFFASNWDDWFVGRNLGTEALGFYTKAYDFTTNTIKQFGNSVVAGVFFPVYARIKADTNHLQRAYLKSVRMVSTIMFPIALGFLATASLLIPIVLGDKWIPMTETFQIFSLLVLSRPISANTSSVFNAVGKPQYNMYAGLLLSAVMVPLVLLLVRYGIAGVAAAVLIADNAAMIFNLFQINRISPGAAKNTLKVSLPALLAALIMFGAVIIVNNYLVVIIGENLWMLIVLVVTGVIVYGVAIFVFQREFMIDLILTAVDVFDKQGRVKRFIAKRKPA